MAASTVPKREAEEWLESPFLTLPPCFFQVPGKDDDH